MIDLNRIPAMFDLLKSQPLYNFSGAKVGDKIVEVMISGGFGTDTKPTEMGFDAGVFYKGLHWTVSSSALTFQRCLKRLLEAVDEDGKKRGFNRQTSSPYESRIVFWGPEYRHTLYIRESEPLRVAIRDARNACSILSNIRKRLTAETAKLLMDSDTDALWRLLRALPNKPESDSP